MSSYFNRFQGGIFTIIKFDNKCSVYFGENSWWLLDDWESDILSNNYLKQIEFLKLEFEEISNAYKSEQFNLNKTYHYLPSLYLDFDNRELYTHFFDQAIENRLIEGWKGLFIENQNTFLELFPPESQYWK
ncbi:hypothetical protein EV144_101956 [Flavobacterium sp. 270]|uniref:hypothetical protein n=1 Tax=Flavobacterium sp. 270 TaxID=2512114 RepID=UPI0010652189|nr:hypothetical protein [Flavobacterium sp. 270]TDW52267.1 hypothetical protein EV144_101956 [Flavobacterium sp. 270]